MNDEKKRLEAKIAELEDELEEEQLANQSSEDKVKKAILQVQTF